MSGLTLIGLWLWLQLIIVGYYLRRSQGRRLYFFDPISLAIYVGITLVTASIQARLNRKSLKDFQGIPTNDETRPIPYIAGSVELSAPHLNDFGDFHRSKVTIAEHVPGFLFFLAPFLAILKFLPIGYRYYCGFDFGLCHGPDVTLKGIRIGDKQVYTGTLAGGTGVVAAPGIFGLEGGAYAVFDFYTGSPTQLQNAYWASQHTRVPGYRGTSHLVWRGPSSGDPALGDIKFSGYVGRTPVLREFKFQLQRIPDNLGTAFALVNGNEANFAEVLYELYTNEAIGIGAPASTFDIPAWQAACETLADEGMGCSFIWDNSSSVGDVINHLRDTIDCVIYSSLEGANAGKLTIKLIRDDYVVDDLIEVTPSVASDVVKFTNRTVDDVPNEIKVSYIDIVGGYVKGEAIWQSMANRQLGETRNTIETDYPVGNATSASKLATRDGLSTVLPLKDVQLKANRQTSRLGPGSVFKFAWPDYDVEQIILRVNNIVLGNLEEPTVVLECIEDRFSLGESAFGTVSTRVWVDPTLPEPQDNLIHTVINQTTTAPPSTPSVGDSYIIATGGTGAWSGQDGCLATWISTLEWQYTCGADLVYTVVYDADTQTLVGHDGSTWATIVTTAYKTIQDEGVAVTLREILNFIGHGVTAADDAGNTRTNVTITSYDTVQDEGSNLTQRPILNFIGAGVTAIDNAGSTRTDVTIPGAATGAPVDATYITQTPNATLTNEQAMSALATGIVKNTTSTGVQSIATVDDISAPAFAADAGANDTYTATLSPVPAAYLTGVHYRFKANTANTGPCSINFNSLGAKTIKKVAGGITTDLADNDIRAGQWVELVYDGTNMQMQSLLGNAPPSTGATINATNKYLPQRSDASTFADSYLHHESGSTETFSDAHIVINSNTSKTLVFSPSIGTGLCGIMGAGNGATKFISGTGGQPGVGLSVTVASTGTGALNPWQSLGQVFRRVLGGAAVVINRPQGDGGANSVGGEILTIILVQDATGSRTAAWATEYKWVGGVAPTLTTTANATDIFRFWVDGSNQAWEISRAMDVK